MNTDIMNTDVIDDFEAMVRRGRSQKVLHAVWLYDEDEECRKLVDESPEYSVYAHEVLRKMDDGLSCYGEDYARAVVPELAEEPLGLVEEALAQMPEEKAKGYQNEFDRLRFSGKDRKVDYYALYGKMVRDEVRGRYEVQKRKQEELQRELDDVKGGLAEALPRYALGEELSPVLMDRVLKFGTPDDVFPSLKRARAAVELVRGWNYGGRSKDDFEDAVQARFERLRTEDLQPVTSGGNLVSETRLRRLHSDEELLQQARSDEGDSYMVSREQIAALADVLSGDDGQLDKGALGAFLLAVDADAQGQQSIDGRFIRNAVEAMKGGLLDAADMLNRGNADAGMVWQGPDMPAFYPDAEGRADFERAYSDNVEALRGHLVQLEGRRLDAAEKAKLHSWLLTKGGSIVGENVPFLAAGALGSAARLGVVGTSVLGGVANAPAMMNRGIGQAFAEGKRNAVFVGSVKGLAQSWAEAAFVPLPGGAAVVNRTLDALARKAISLPGAGKVIGAVWGNGLMRYVATTAGASAGELLGEEVLAQSVQYPVLSFAKAVGVDLDEPEWKPFTDSWEVFNDDPRQAAATVVYCSLLGALGAPANARAAREFALEYRNLMAAGLKPGSARRLCLQAEQASSFKEQEKLREDMQEVYLREVVEGDPVELKKRLKKEGESFLNEVEVQMYARSGVRDYVLQRAGVLATEKTVAGLNRVSLPNVQNPESPAVVEWSDEQLNAWVEMQHESKVVEAMRDLQSRVAGAALGDAQLDDAEVKGMLVNLRELPIRALARMERTGGRVTYAVLKDLATDAREQVAGFVEGGMSMREAYRQMSEIPGVRLGTLVNAAESFTQRVEAIVGTPEGVALGIRTVDDASTSVFRLDGATPGQSVLLFNKGIVSEREMVEDLIERDVVAATSGENAVTSLKSLEKLLRRVQSHLLRYEGGMRLLPKGKEATEMDIVEAFSKLAQSRFLLNHRQYNMPQEAHDTIEYVQKKMASTQHLVALSRAWDAFARSEEGRAFIEREGATLEKLMSDAGASVAGQYSRARFTADAFEAVKLAYEQSFASPEAALPLLNEYESEQQELDHPKEQEICIPGAESVIGEELPLFDVAPVSQESGEMVLAPGEVELSGGNPGRGLMGERYVEVGDGSVMGVAEVDGISLSADVPQFKKKESAAGRVEADADGTTHELAGGWNANAAPIHVWRRREGRLEVISGRHRLAHARKNGVRFVPVRVYDESAECDARWAKLHDVEQNILDNTCNAIDVAYYFRHNPLSMAEAEARGLLPKTRAGEQTAASRIGLTVAAQAADNTFALLVNGKCTAEDAYMACLIASTEEGQQLALESRAGRNGRKNSWEYVTALVRGAEQMQPEDGGMLDLFGHDESFRERSEKLARYVAAVREGLKARIAVFVNSSKLNRKADVAKELGVQVSTPEDATRLISRLANLDAAYERLDPDLGIPAKADAWDGKSAVPTKLDELAAGSSFSLNGIMSPEMQQIKDAAEKSGTFMKAPNGKPTRLTELQWLTVRTAAFKGWFGDWERAAELTFNGGEISYKEAKDRLAQDEEQIRNDETGIEVPINSTQRTKMTSQKAMRKSLTNGFTAFQHNSVVARIKGVFKHAIKIGDYNDKNNDPNIESIKRFASPVMIDGEKALAFMTVKCSYQKKKLRGEKPTKEVVSRLYSVELDEIVKLDGHMKRLEYLQQNTSASSSEEIVNAFNAKVKEYFDEYSKVVDANGEPLVVYHGSPHYGFTVFDKARRGERDKGDFGKGFYFTPNRGYAATYGKEGYWNAEGDDSKVYACFLNIREPMQVQARQAENMERWKFEDAEGVMVYTDKFYDLAWNDVKNLSEIVVHDSTQIKSATDNRGTFDGSNPDITYSVIGRNARTWSKYTDRAFVGRDDGMWRAELDASQAKLKARVGTAGDVYRRFFNGMSLPFHVEEALDAYAERQKMLNKYYDFMLDDEDFEAADAYMKAQGMDEAWHEEVNQMRKVVKDYVEQALLAAGVTGEGKYGTLTRTGSRLMQAIIDSLVAGKVNEDVANELNLMSKGAMRTLGNVLDYPELYDAYPDLKWLPVYAEDLGLLIKGKLERNGGYPAAISVNERLEGEMLRSTLLHEVQHAIQTVEEFASGGNAEMARNILERDVKRYKLRLAPLRSELRWINAVDSAKDVLKRMIRVMKRPRAILKMAERFDVHEVQDVDVMAQEAVEVMWKEYQRMAMQDAGDSDSYAPGEGYALPGLGYVKHALADVEGLLAMVEALPSRRAGKLRGRGKQLEAELERLYDENRAKLDMGHLSDGELYLRLAGEIESRNVQLRRDWSADKRAAVPFNDTLEYPGEALVTFSLQSVMADWQNTLHGYLNNAPKPGSAEHARDLVVCPTPAVMRMVGAKGWDMVVTPGVLDKVMKGKHAVSVIALEQLPAALAEPICIAVSDTPGCLEVVTELKEGQHNVLVAVQLNSNMHDSVMVKVNRIASMYGKEKIASLLSHPMLYWDKAKARPWLASHRLQLPAVIQPKRASGRKILKPADLVKYKMANGLSFSLRGRGMIDAVDVGVMAREVQMQRLVNHARREAARWERTFAGDTPNAKAAEAMGAISSIQAAIYKVLPQGYRPALAAQMRYVEVFARMLERGRVSAKGKLSKEERAELQEQMEAELKPKMEGLKPDAARELKYLFVRDWGEANLAQAAARMLNDAAAAVERWMIDVELAKVERMKEHLAPRKLPNGKYDKGRMSAGAYKKFVRFCELMELDADVVGERMQDLEALVAEEENTEQPDDAKVDKLASELAELAAYGNLKEKSLEAVRKGVAALVSFVQNERNVWQGKQELERMRAKRAARNMAELMGHGDEVKLAENAEKAEGTVSMFSDMGSGFRSLAQMFYGMGGIPGLRALMDESLDALTRGHIQLGLREQRAYDQLGRFLEETLGLDTETKRNDWMAGLKKKIDTGVKRAGELVTHKLELTQEETEGWLALSKEERDKKRQEMQEEADKTGVDAQNVVYEEDIPLLRDELAKFDDMPGKRKFIRTERSWRKVQAGNIVASKDEILNILLLCEQAEYQQAADENGYTAAVLEKLRAVVGEDVMAYGHEMRRILEGGGLAAVYEAREGIPFPAVQNYWPGKFDLSAKMNEQANALDPTTGTGTRYGMLITRVKHKLKFNLTLGASNVFLAAMAQQNNYICVGELTARWRRLLSHSNFAMSLKQRLGEKQFKQLKELLNLLDGAGIAESVTQQNLSSLLGRFQSAHSMAVLAGSPITLIKQTSAMLHAGAWEGISPARVVWHLLKDRAGKGAVTYADVVQMDCFKVRYRDNRYFTEMMQLGRNANWSKLATWARSGMGWIEKMDVVCNAASMTALYNIRYEQLLEANRDAADPLSEEEIRGICRKSVEQALELAAQPLRRTQKSAYAALSRNALVKSACYMSTEALNKIGMYSAIKHRNGGGIKGRVAALKFLLPMSIAQQATVMALDMLRGSAPSDDDEWAEWFWLNVATGCTGLGMLQSVPMLGEVVGWASGGYAKTSSLGEMLFDFRGAARSVKRLWKMGTDDREYQGVEWLWQLMNTGRIVTAGTAAGRGINSTSKVFSEVSGGLQSLNAVVNHVRPFIQRWRNEVRKR